MSNIRDVNVFIKKYYKTDTKLSGAGKGQVLERIGNICDLLSDEVKRQDALLDAQRAGVPKKAAQKEKKERPSAGPKLFDEKDIDRDLAALAANTDPFSYPESFRNALLEEREACSELMDSLPEGQKYARDALGGVIKKIEELQMYFPPLLRDVKEKKENKSGP
jgi:hypothetical protein